ncbi:MAG: hypothetical protein K6G17_03865 [Oscillospiraceae bacterium]|nr:hypothetical protein [Oscillospiraceae bacterium]
MKKFQISGFYNGVYFIGLCSGAFLIAIGIYGINCLGVSFHVLLPFIVGLIGIAGVVYQMLFDFTFGSVILDSRGITMKIGFKKYCHLWEAIVEAGYINSYTGNGYVTWVYFSEAPLSSEEKKQFLKKTRNNYNTIAFFQYKEKTFRAILPLLPERISSEVIEMQKDI